MSRLLDNAPETIRLAELGLMSAGIAHDLGNLLQIVASGLNQLERRFDSQTSPEIRQATHDVISVARRATSLTRRILDRSRHDEAQVERLDLAVAIEAIRPLIGWAAGPEVKLEFDLDPEAPKVRCDPRRFEDALINLAMNAGQAMPSGGRLTISLASAPPASDRPMAILSVKDTGVGVTPDVAERMFQPFLSGKPRGCGTGLGLAIVAGFVRGLEGRVDVESRPGLGTAIVLRLPADQD